MRKLAPTIQLNVTPAIAAKMLKDMCGKKGKDVIEHLLEVIGTNDQQMLDYTFNSMDSSYHHNGQFKEGQVLSFIEEGGLETRMTIDHILVKHNIKSIALKEKGKTELKFYSPRELDKLIKMKVVIVRGTNGVSVI